MIHITKLPSDNIETYKVNNKTVYFYREYGQIKCSEGLTNSELEQFIKHTNNEEDN